MLFRFNKIGSWVIPVVSIYTEYNFIINEILSVSYVLSGEFYIFTFIGI